MARINVEQKALIDPRFRVLGLELGAPPEHAQAVGLFAAIKVWNYCAEIGRSTLPPGALDGFGELLENSMLKAKLAVASRHGTRIKGAFGRLDYLKKLRQSNRNRQRRRRELSRVTAALVTRDTPGAPALALSYSDSEVSPEIRDVFKPSCAEPSEDGRSTPLAFPVHGRGRIWECGPEARTELGLAFPALDLEAELRKARAWLLSNPTRQKTARGMPKFLYAWMERAQNGTRGAAKETLSEANARRTAGWGEPEP